MKHERKKYPWNFNKKIGSYVMTKKTWLKWPVGDTKTELFKLKLKTF